MSIWSSIWPSVDRYSLQYFKYVINELREIDVVHKQNTEIVTDLLQSIVEIVTYGDRQDPLIFECFMEYQVLAEFVRVLRISRNSNIEAPLLQYLSIMIQNMCSEHAIYYCLSNGYINCIIEHKYDFHAGDLASYYMSFLRAVSSKINRDTLCLIVKVDRDVVTAFPLYVEALKFAHHGDMMIQTAVRALTLNIYNVSDTMVFQFVTNPPASKYFSDLVYSLREKCIRLNGLIKPTEQTCTQQMKKEILLESDKIVDDLYYFKDILSVGEPSLSKVVNRNLLSLLVFPILLPLLQSRQSNGFHMSAIASLYIVSHLLQVVGGKDIFNCVAGVILYPYMTLRKRDPIEGETTNGIGSALPLFNILNDMEIMEFFETRCEGEENIKENHMSWQLAEHISFNFQPDSFTGEDDICKERSGIFRYIFSDNYNLSLASIFLLLILAESADLDCSLAAVIGRSKMLDIMLSASPGAHGHILVTLMPQVLSALLKILASQPPSRVLIQFHPGWFLHNLLISQRMTLSDHNLHEFNTSYQQSSERLQKELEECWFDHILDTVRGEWTNCREVLEEPLQSKNPFFSIELAVCEETTCGADYVYGDNITSDVAWQRMVDAVKVFVLHCQLKAVIFKGNLLEKSLVDFNNLTTDTATSPSSDLLSASFGSEVSLGSGIPCRIAFFNAGVRDIYLIPLSRGATGKLILAEKHPFRNQRGVVIAIAPLAGLTPRIDENHPTWLHLRIREFDPRYLVNKNRGYQSKRSSSSAVDGRWTLGFTSKKACEAAHSSILEETRKQRSFVESVLAPILQDNFIEELSDN